ncbi:MAG: pyridoxal-phosphate dependent enzyme [Candidatus Kariarchaeaceae archaeon]
MKDHPYIEQITCSCGKEYTFQTCPANDGCGKRINFTFNLEKVKEVLTWEELANRKNNPFVKYKELLPLADSNENYSLGEGNTPIIHAQRLGKKLGLTNLYLKNEMINPSGSFKDRPISVGVARAKEMGATTVTAASSGNAAAALSTYAAHLGLQAVVFVPDNVPKGKLAHLLLLGAKVIRGKRKEGEVEDPTTRLLQLAIDNFGWTPCPSFGPFNCFQFEGTKTLGYEIIEYSRENKVPFDKIFFPTGSGGLLSGTMKGMDEFRQMGLVNEIPQPFCIQPKECAPIVEAFKKNKKPNDVDDWMKTPNTIAGGLADPHPWDGDAAIHWLNETNGQALAVTEDQIRTAHKLLARQEGLFGEPSGVAGLAGLMVAVEKGMIDPSERILLPITGLGLKDTETVNELLYEPIYASFEELDELRKQF